MDEDEYKSAYHEITSDRCFFEKALTNRQAKCLFSRHFCLADREGYACKNTESSMICKEFLEKLRKSSMFVLRLRGIREALPHNMEIRVQAGGIRGLSTILDTCDSARYETVGNYDVHDILSRALEKYGSFHTLPYSEIIQSVKKFKGRSRRLRR